MRALGCPPSANSTGSTLGFVRFAQSRALPRGLLTLGPGLPRRSMLCSALLCFLRSFAPSAFRRLSTLLRPLLTSPRLSPQGSPRVRTPTFIPRRPTLLHVSGWMPDFAFASTLVAHAQPRCRFVFLRSVFCLRLLSATASRPLPCRSATVTSISSDQFLSSD